MKDNISIGAVSTSSRSADKKADLALRQANLLGCTSNEFLDKYYNLMIQSWRLVVKETAMPLIIRELIQQNPRKSNNEAMVDKLLKRLLNRLFQNGRFQLIFQEAEDFISKYLFNVPPNFLTKEERQRIKKSEEVPDDEERLWNEIREHEQEILKIRLQLQYLKNPAFASKCREMFEQEEPAAKE